jgi:hypothetical protein
MQCEYGADMTCWAKKLLKNPVLTLHSVLFYYGAIFVLTTDIVNRIKKYCYTVPKLMGFFIVNREMS